MLTNNIILILASLGLFQGFFLSFYLLTLRKGNRKLNIFLALTILGLTIRIGKSVLNYYIPMEAWQRNIGISGIFISGPCLWFYGRILIEKNKPFTNKKYFHLIPFILFILLFAVIPSNGEFERYWNYGLVVFHLAIYLILSWVLLLKSQLKPSDTIFRWYRNILLGVTLVWCFYLGNFLNLNLYYITEPTPLDMKLVKDFVVAGHKNLKLVKEMLQEYPNLIYSRYDWGNGDFEEAIEGAGHLGNKEIANYLISQGARVNLFVLTMLGKSNLVIPTLNTYPELVFAKGPHGFTLLHHAKIGESKEIYDYLIEQGLKETQINIK